MKSSPCSHRLSHALLEGEIEGAVTPVAAIVGQLLDGKTAMGSNCFTIETDEMIDAEIIDVGIVCDTQI